MLELNKIYCRDCLEGLIQMEDNSVDLTISSPPYDKLRIYNGYSFNFEEVARQLFRVTKQGGVVVWVVSDSTINGSESGTSFRQALFFKEIGFNLHDTMIYRKLNYTPLTHRRYEQEWEFMFVFSKGRPNTFNPIKMASKFGGQETWGKPSYYKTSDGKLTTKPKQIISETKIKGNIFEYRTGSTQTGDIEHPAVFPEQLAEDQILSWSNEGDIILDPFIGSGTVAKMCILTNRKFIGFDISNEYVKIAQERIKPYLEQKTLKEVTQGC